MSHDIRIRAFARDDLPALQTIRAAAFAPIFEAFRAHVGDAIYTAELADSAEEQARLLDALCADPDANNVHVAERGGAIVGFVSFMIHPAKPTAEIGLNAVHPDHAGRGVGAALYDFALAQMKARGVQVAWVSTGGDNAHAPARRAYEKTGFTHTIPSVAMYRLL